MTTRRLRNASRKQSKSHRKTDAETAAQETSTSIDENDPVAQEVTEGTGASTNENEAVAQKATEVIGTSTHENEAVAQETTEVIGTSAYENEAVAEGTGTSTHENEMVTQEATYETETSPGLGSQTYPIVLDGDETSDQPSNKRKRRLEGLEGFEAAWQKVRVQWPEIATKWLASKDPDLVTVATAFGITMTEIEKTAASRLNNAWKKYERRLYSGGKGITDRLKFSRTLEDLEACSKVPRQVKVRHE